MAFGSRREGDSPGVARLLRVGAGVWAGASLLMTALTLGAALLNPYGQGLLALGWLLGAAVVGVAGAAEVVRRRIGVGGAAVALVAYAFPVVLLFAATEASRRLAPSALELSPASPFLVPLLLALYLAGAILARAADEGPLSSVVGAFLLLPGGAVLILSSAMAWNALHSLEWRNRGVSLRIDEASWRAGALLVAGTLDLARADPADLATLDNIDALYVYPLVSRSVWARPERLDWLDGEGRPARPGRYRFRVLFSALEAGREAQGSHEVRLLLTRPAVGGRESVRELRAPVPRPPFPVVELSHYGTERAAEAVNVRSFLAVSRPGSYRIEAILQAMDRVAAGTVREDAPLDGLAPETVEWARGVTEPYRFTPIGPTIELRPEDSGVLAVRWRSSLRHAVAIVRVREADRDRRLLKEARIPVG